VSTLLYFAVYVFLHTLMNVLVQIANKMGLQKKNKQSFGSVIFVIIIEQFRVIIATSRAEMLRGPQVTQ
jgi:uncharacterized membrane protein